MKEIPNQKNHAHRFDPGRRDTLKKLGFAAAASALGMPTIIPSSALAQATTKADKPPPSGRINIGLIGLGDAMAGHQRILLARKDVFVRYVCDVDRNRAETEKKAAERAGRSDVSYTGCSATQDYREVIASDEIDAVVVATPCHWHAGISLEAIRAGKDVLCQAPMSLTVREGEMVTNAAEQYGAIFQVITPHRCDDDVRKAAQLARNGYLGDIKSVYVSVGRYNEQIAPPKQKIPAEFDYDRWLGPAPWAPYHSARIAGSATGWRRYWEYGDRKHGWDGFGYYDAIQWALGTENTGPTEYVPSGVDGEVFSSYRYKNGAVVQIDHPIEGDLALQIIGTQASVSVTARGRFESETKGLTSIKPSASDEKLHEMNSSEVDWLRNIQVRSTPMVNARVGHNSSNISHLNALAERLDRAIKWDPDKKDIDGDPGLARWIDRPRRAPYTLS